MAKGAFAAAIAERGCGVQALPAFFLLINLAAAAACHKANFADPSDVGPMVGHQASALLVHKFQEGVIDARGAGGILIGAQTPWKARSCADLGAVELELGGTHAAACDETG